MLQLNLKGHSPLYQQIKEQMKTMIISGALKPDEKIPSVRDLAQMLTINPNTIQKAYKELEQEGFIYSVRAKGSFVTPRDNTLKEVRINELMNNLEKTVREQIYVQVPYQQVVLYIKKLYAEEGSAADD